MLTRKLSNGSTDTRLLAMGVGKTTRTQKSAFTALGWLRICLRVMRVVMIAQRAMVVMIAQRVTTVTIAQRVMMVMMLQRLMTGSVPICTLPSKIP